MAVPAGPAAGPADMMVPVRVGELVSGKYEIEKILGAGGMGAVVAARHIHLQGRVALKFLLPHLEANHDFAARFVREAQASARLQSEHVVRVLDTGVHGDGHPYLVMECLEGCNLDDLLEVRGRLSVEDAVRYVLEAMEAVAEAHSIGIVHRDLKPSNLFLVHRPDGSQSIKVLDFGISKSLDEGPSDAALTRSNNMLGSPVYMSPEQVRSARQVDVRSDIWSVGIILHELVAGTPPFLGDTMSATLASVVADEPPVLHTVCPDAPVGLSQVVLRCLAKKPDGRFADLAELATALLPWADGDGQKSITRIIHLGQHPHRSGSALAPGVVVSAEFARQSASNRPMTASVSRLVAEQASMSRSRWLPVGLGAGLAALGAVFLMHRASAPNVVAGPVAAASLTVPGAASVAPVEPVATLAAAALPTTPEVVASDREARGGEDLAKGARKSSFVQVVSSRRGGSWAGGASTLTAEGQDGGAIGANRKAPEARAAASARPTAADPEAAAPVASVASKPKDMGSFFEDRR